MGQLGVKRGKYKPRKTRTSKIKPNGLLVSYGQINKVTCKKCKGELPSMDRLLTPSEYKQAHNLENCPYCGRKLAKEFEWKWIKK